MGSTVWHGYWYVTGGCTATFDVASNELTFEAMKDTWRTADGEHWELVNDYSAWVTQMSRPEPVGRCAHNMMVASGNMYLLWGSYRPYSHDIDTRSTAEYSFYDLWLAEAHIDCMVNGKLCDGNGQCLPPVIPPGTPTHDYDQFPMVCSCNGTYGGLFCQACQDGCVAAIVLAPPRPLAHARVAPGTLGPRARRATSSTRTRAPCATATARATVTAPKVRFALECLFMSLTVRAGVVCSYSFMSLTVCRDARVQVVTAGARARWGGTSPPTARRAAPASDPRESARSASSGTTALTATRARRARARCTHTATATAHATARAPVCATRASRAPTATRATSTLHRRRARRASRASRRQAFATRATRRIGVQTARRAPRVRRTPSATERAPCTALARACVTLAGTRARSAPRACQAARAQTACSAKRGTTARTACRAPA